MSTPYPSPDATPSPADDALRKALDDERAAKKIAADAADRFRDVLSECLGHEDENPGDDVLVAELREHFGRTGPEPTRWRDFCVGALSVADQAAAWDAGRAAMGPIWCLTCDRGATEVCEAEHRLTVRPPRNPYAGEA